jgi:hypothetical protein
MCVNLRLWVMFGAHIHTVSLYVSVVVRESCNGQRGVLLLYHPCLGVWSALFAFESSVGLSNK